MANGTNTTMKRLRTLAVALALAATGAWGMGDRPPEDRGDASKAGKPACEDAKGGSPAGCDPDRAGKATSPDGGKPRDSRPDRFGTGYEARKGLRAGGGGGRGGRGR